MGKKYIIELEDENYHQYSDSEPSDYLWRVKGFNALVFDEVGISKLTPYTEPDLERVKKTAHDDGYSEGYQAGREDLNIVMSDVEQAKADAYLKGLNDGQGVILASTQNNAFNNGYKKCLKDIEQVRKEAYEEGFKDGQYAERNGLVANYAQVHKIKIGDEVIAEHGGSTFTVTWMSDVCICGIDSDGRCYSYEINEVDGKTGNHHDIAAILEKMRGEQDG